MTRETYHAHWENLNARWVERGSPFLQTQLVKASSTLPLSQDTVTFLSKWGLPKDTAPFLHFEEASILPQIPEVYGIPEDWSQEERERLAPFLILGGDGAGNPICLDMSRNECVVLLDHEVRFTVSQFVNTGVRQLGECLRVYSAMVEESEDGCDPSDPSGAIPLSLWRQTEERLRATDPEAMQEGNFWFHEMAALPILLDAGKQTV